MNINNQRQIIDKTWTDRNFYWIQMKWSFKWKIQCLLPLFAGIKLP